MFPRPKQHLITASRRWPDAWKLVDQMRVDRGKDLPDWPEWCFLPLAGAHAIVTGGGFHTPSSLDDMAVGVVGALAAWRPTQGIYRFHTDLFEAVWDTPIEGELPIELLYHLPEWCVYIETPGKRFSNHEIYGFFAHLEYDVNDGRSELRFLIDASHDRVIPIALHLVPGGIAASVERFMVHASAEKVTGHDLESWELLKHELAIATSPLISLVLYLCTTAAEYRTDDSERVPTKPRPTKTKRGLRHFPPNEPTVWETGFRIGEALRRATSTATTGSGGAVRPHIRRAHWHTYWVGPKSDPTQRRAELRWLPPIPVNLDSETDVNPTVRHVK